MIFVEGQVYKVRHNNTGEEKDGVYYNATGQSITFPYFYGPVDKPRIEREWSWTYGYECEVVTVNN